MGILCLGLSHRTAPLAVRERLALARDEIPEAAAMVRRLSGVGEDVVVSTCNRVELYLSVGGKAEVRRSRGVVIRLLARYRRVPAAVLTRASYLLEGTEAVRHLIEVAAGLDSQVVGETQILGQVRDAHEAALRSGATGPVLNGVFNRALAAAKRIRTETEIGRLPASVSSVAVDLASRVFGELAGRSVLLIGTGETAELVAEALVEGGAPHLLVASSGHPERARVLAQRWNGEALDLKAVPSVLPRVDIVIAATQVSEPLIRCPAVAEAMRQRKSRPAFLVDLGVPRNIEDSVGGLPDVYLYNLDDLKAVADENLKRREAWLAPAKRIAEEETQAIAGWLESLDVVPLIRDLQSFGEETRREVLARSSARLRGLPPEVSSEIDYLTKALVAKLLHHPVSQLKALASSGQAADLVRRLFRLP